AQQRRTPRSRARATTSVGLGPRLCGSRTLQWWAPTSGEQRATLRHATVQVMSPPLPDEPSTGVTRISETALERRVKRWLLSGPFECYLPVAPGLEEILCAELVGLRLAPDRASLKTEYGGVGLRLDL